VLPDLAGFKAAQDRLVDVMGQEVTWIIEGEETWPDGTVLDDETGRPMDPRIEPESSGDSEVTFKASIVSKPLSGGVDESPIGLLREGQIAAIVKTEDRDQIEDAKSAVVMGRTYAVKDIVEDGIERVTRYVVILEPRA
jgi:hypothetical protein